MSITGVSVIGLIEAKTVLPVRLGSDAEVNALLLTPVEFWRDSDEAMLGQLVAFLTDVGIHPEYLVQNDDRWGRGSFGASDVRAKGAVATIDGNSILHCILLK
jgi:hypothetical protein